MDRAQSSHVIPQKLWKVDVRCSCLIDKNLTQATQLTDSKTLAPNQHRGGPQVPTSPGYFVVQNVQCEGGFYSELGKNSTFINNLPVEIVRHLSSWQAFLYNFITSLNFIIGRMMRVFLKKKKKNSPGINRYG